MKQSKTSDKIIPKLLELYRSFGCEKFKMKRFEEYDFLNNHPDIIYIQNPYDEYNRVVTVASFFYAKNLRKYTEKLVYIPFFTMDEIDTDKARQTMDYFCRVPGVVCSDLVLVQSENMRQAYISYLTELSGEEYRPIWEDKIQVRQ